MSMFFADNTSISFLIILITCLVSFSGFKRQKLIGRYSFSPYYIVHQKEYYRIFSHAFFHANQAHLFFNMISLFLVGRFLEYYFVRHFGVLLGEFHFLVIYFGGTAFGTLHAFKKYKDNPNYQSIGASGAVSSVIFGLILWVPTIEFLLFFVIPMKAYVFGLLFLAFEYFSMKKYQSNVAHDVHIISALFGVFYILCINFDKGIEFIHLFL